VTYTVTAQDPKKDTFTASLVVANRDTAPVADWKLWWIMPGDQTLVGNGQEKLLQQDRGVTVTAADTLAPQQAKSLAFAGRFKASNASPMAFQLGSESCQAYVAATPGGPLRPVEQLSDGTTRLGPLPASADPQLGISAAPTSASATTSKSTTKPVDSSGPGDSVTTSPPPDDDGGVTDHVLPPGPPDGSHLPDSSVGTINLPPTTPAAG
jgi:serine/threonine-protein kinase